jgi:ABC-type arginine transport system ATPase subunit
MQKRVSFARAVMYDPDDVGGPCRAPDVMLLDEPTAVRLRTHSPQDRGDVRCADVHLFL